MRASLARSNCLFRLLLILCCLLVDASLSPPVHPRAQTSSSPSSIADLRARAESGDSAAAQSLVNFVLQADTLTPGYDIAQAWVRSWASRNDASALFLLGYFYEHGLGVPRDYTKAAESYEKAALQGYAIAQNNLGSLYHRGLGVHKNAARAFRLYLAAAEQRTPVAQWNLGHFYFEGIGTSRDFSEAARWFRAAAELSDPMAQYDLGILYSRGLGVPLDYAEAARWILSAAEQGNVHAQYALAYLYETGKGVPLDYVAAYTWYSRAIARGDRTASRRCKSLSHLMTRKERNEANALLSPSTR